MSGLLGILQRPLGLAVGGVVGLWLPILPCSLSMDGGFDRELRFWFT